MTDEKKLIIYREAIIPNGVGLDRKTLIPSECSTMSCAECAFRDADCATAEDRLDTFNNWLQNNDKEEESKQFEIGEPALFRDTESGNWVLALFTGFENGKFTSSDYGSITKTDVCLRKCYSWNYIKKIKKINKGE